MIKRPYDVVIIDMLKVIHIIYSFPHNWVNCLPQLLYYILIYTDRLFFITEDLSTFRQSDISGCEV